MRLYVAYFWTSRNRYSDTRAQLEEQKTEIARHVSYNHGRIAGEYLAGEYTEEDVSWRSTWPRLAEAIALTKRVQGTLIIARADRLVHNSAFTRMLLESGVKFVCCDNREFHEKTVHIWANMAEIDSRRTSARVKAGLSAAKARGVKLGSARDGHWEGREELRRAGIRKGQPMATKAAAEARSRAAREAYSGLMPLIIKMREGGLTMAEIAERINAEGHLTRAGKPFSDSMIVRLLQRAKRTEPQPTAAPPERAAEYSDPPRLCLCPDTAGAAFEAAHQ
jgi:DNA invertase Pin-like site-specific DNA recombinase